MGHLLFHANQDTLTIRDHREELVQAFSDANGFVEAKSRDLLDGFLRFMADCG